MTIRFLQYFLVFLLSIQLFGQSTYEPGYVILSKGDTIYGSINYSPKVKNLKSEEICKFKNDTGVDKYRPAEIEGFGTIGGQFFVSNIVEDQFVEVLVSGRLNLYKGDLVFYTNKEGDSSTYTLDGRKSVTEVGGKKVLKENSAWRGVLNSLTFDCAGRRTNFEKIIFKQRSLVDAVQEYNQCFSGNSVVFNENKSWVEASIGVSAGFAVTAMSVTETFGSFLPLAQNITGFSYRDTSPYLSFPITIATPRITEKFEFEFSPQILFTRFSTDGNSPVEITFNNIILPIGVRYYFTKGKNSLFGVGGVLFSHSPTAQADLNSGEYNFHKNHDGYHFGLGYLKSLSKFNAGVTLRYQNIKETRNKEAFLTKSSRIMLSIVLVSKKKIAFN